MPGMKLGLFSANMSACSHPEAIARVARVAEDAGFESLWAGEHVILPDPQQPPSPMGPQDRSLDPIVALTYAAAHSSRLRLGTGIIILPQRNPVVLAKELASLDVLSSGRLLFGIGVGYLEAEFRAIGAPFADRGARTTAYLEAIDSLWYDEHPTIKTPFVQFSGVDAHPRPVQHPVPLVIGATARAPTGERSSVGTAGTASPCRSSTPVPPSRGCRRRWTATSDPTTSGHWRSASRPPAGSPPSGWRATTGSASIA
jgi:probable F420-dependent oxidoreductase